MRYERAKHDGTLPIVGVNVFVGPPEEGQAEIELARSSEAEKRDQIERLAAFHARHAEAAPDALERVKRTAVSGGNVFEALLEAAEVCSLGQLTEALFAVGGGGGGGGGGAVSTQFVTRARARRLSSARCRNAVAEQGALGVQVTDKLQKSDLEVRVRSPMPALGSTTMTR